MRSRVPAAWVVTSCFSLCGPWVGTGHAASTGVTPKDPAQIEAFTAKIDTPYPNRFFFESSVPDYPVLEQVVESPPSTGPAVDVQSAYDSPQGGQNSAVAVTRSDGFFASSAKLEDPIDGFEQGYSGVMSGTYWSRGYTITDPDTASIEYTVTEGRAEVYCLGGSVRSEIAFDVNLYIPLIKDTPYSNVHEHAAIFALPGNQQYLFETGPMTYSTFEPKGTGSKRLTLDTYTGTLDLSGLLEGMTIYVEYSAWTAVSFAGFEVSQGEAFFQDPISGSGGISIQTHGLQAVPEPERLVLLALLLAIPMLRIRAVRARTW